MLSGEWAGTAPATMIYCSGFNDLYQSYQWKFTLESGFFIVRSFYGLDGYLIWRQLANSEVGGNARDLLLHGTGDTILVNIRSGGHENIFHLWSTDFYIRAYMWSHIWVYGYMLTYITKYMSDITHTSHIWANICHLWANIWSYMINWFLYKCLYVIIYKGIKHICWLTLTNICHILRIHVNICPYISHICTIYV